MFHDLLTRFGNDLIDVIKAIPARDNSGTLALVTEIAALESRYVPGVDLVTFARQHFGHGILRKVGEGFYAVLRREPTQPRQRETNVRPLVAAPVPVFPAWAYNV